MVEPVTIAVLGGLGALASTVSGWFASRAAKKKRESAKHAAAKPAAPRAVPGRPADLPKITPQELVAKWFERVRALLTPSVGTPPQSTLSAPKKTGTQRVVATLNRLEPVFQAAVVTLVLWLLLQPLLLLVNPGLVDAIPSWTFLLLTSAAVGYGTNWIALKMLFRPQRKNKVWRGVIPDRKAQLVEAISDSVIERLLGPDIIRRYLQESHLLRDVLIQANDVARKVVDDRAFRQDVKAVLYDAVARFATSDDTKDMVAQGIETKLNDWTGTNLGARLAQTFKGVWGPFVKKEILNALPDLPRAVEHAFGRVDEKLLSVPDWLEARQGRIEQAIAEWISVLLKRIDFKPIVVGELRRMNPDQLEAMLSKPLSGELQFVKTSGGLFGLAVAAAIQWLPVRILIIGFAMILILVYYITVERPAPAEAAALPAPAVDAASE